MSNNLQPILALIEEQRDQQRDLLKLSYEKRQTVTKGDTERLNEIVQQELNLLSRINSLEKQRMAAAARIAEGEGCKAAEVTLTFLIQLSEGADRDRFTALQREMSGLLQAQAELNKINKSLLEEQLEYTDAMLGILVGAEDPLNNFYNVDGTAEQERRQRTGLIDRQV